MVLPTPLRPPPVIPRGVRNFNPGNIRSGSVTWVGQRGQDKDGFCIFKNAEDGIRALGKLLLQYQKLHHLNQIQTIIARWAPGNENNTEAYIKAVAKRMKIYNDEVLNLMDKDVLKSLTVAIIWHENGQQPYPDEMLDKAIYRALII